MEQNKDSGQIFCESVEIIAKSILEGITFDQTIKCVIVDAANAEKGEYRVSNGSATFLAYSTEKYLKNTNVYVLIPQGDYNNKKLIIGKITAENENIPYNYVKPFDTFFGIINEKFSNSLSEGLVANYLGKELKTENNITYRDLDKVEEKIGELAIGSFTNDFTRFGIKANFKSLLEGFDCVEGDYGLRIEITCEQDRDLEAPEDSVKYETRILFLNSKDMIGNPYGFNTFFSQEKVFDITDLGNITNISVFFYQNPLTFKDRKGEFIPDIDDSEGKKIVYPPNLFVSDVELSIGYDISSIAGDYVQIYTLDNSTYDRSGEPAVHKKLINLRWLHENELKQKTVMSPASEEPFEIRWYKYKFNAPAADNYSGVCWERIAPPEGKVFTLDFEPDQSLAQEQVKAIVVYGELPIPIAYEKGKLAWSTVEANVNRYYIEYTDSNNEVHKIVPNSSMFNYTNQNGDKNTNEIRVYELVEDTRKVYRSNILTFTNKDNVSNPVIYDILNGLTLNCYYEENGQQLPSGVHLVYDSFGSIVDRQYSQRNYIIECALRIDEGNTSIENKQFDEIRWIYPGENMIKGPGSKINTTDSVNLYQYKESRSENNGITGKFQYKIENRYTPAKDKNWVRCEVDYKGITYIATQELYFGYESTMGSNYSIQIVADKDWAAFTEGISGQSLTLSLDIYDDSFVNINQDRSQTVTWELIPVIEEEEKPKWLSYSNSGKSFKLTYDKGAKQTGGYIVRAAWTYSHEPTGTQYKIYDYYPIARRNNTALEALIPERIVYSSEGKPSYSKVPLQLFKIAENPGETTNLLGGVTWTDITLNKEFRLSVNKDDGRLSPPAFYCKPSSENNYHCRLLKGTKELGSTIYEWIVPIVLYQNNYFSSLIDDWSNTGVQISDTGGYILSNMLAAGSKDDKNRFSGVVMGDWAQESTDLGQAGLYGFGDGEMAFAFKEDGTAFIGKSGAGRIEFNGDKGTIKSAYYDEKYQPGTCFDLDDASLILRGGGKYGALTEADTTERINGITVLEPDRGPLKTGKISKNEYNIFKENNILLYYLTPDQPGVYTEINYQSHAHSESNYYYRSQYKQSIDLNASRQKHPMKIGVEGSEKFKVDWDGTLEATGADISGKITADVGQLGGWYIGEYKYFIGKDESGKDLYSTARVISDSENADWASIILLPSFLNATNNETLPPGIYGPSIRVGGGNLWTRPNFEVDSSGNLGASRYASGSGISSDNYRFIATDGGVRITQCDFILKPYDKGEGSKIVFKKDESEDLGSIYYEQDAGSEELYPKRMWIKSDGSLKLKARTRLSIESEDPSKYYIYFNAPINAKGGIWMGEKHFGSEHPDEREFTTTLTTGQLYFQIIE